jgi:uncharacterized protein YbaR (Trm112 family)
VDSHGIDDQFLQALRCPVSGRPLRRIFAAELATLNRQIEAGSLYTRLGTRVTQLLSEAVGSDDDRWVYPVSAGIPQLLPGEAIDRTQRPE